MGQRNTTTSHLHCLPAAAACIVVVWSAALGFGQTATVATPHVEVTPENVTTEQVEAGIARGLKFLMDRRNAEGRWTTPYSRQFAGASEGLAILTALAAGEKPDSDRMKKSLDVLSALDPATVFARSLRIMVYSRLGPSYSKRLKEDVDYLVSQQGNSGGWGYGVGHETTEFLPNWTDISNTQIAVLALRDAADAGAVIPPATWRKCRTYLTSSQRKDGGWGYQATGEGAGLWAQSYSAATAAGVASLEIVAARVAPMDGGDEKSRVPAVLEDQAAIDRGMKFLADQYQPMQDPALPQGMAPEVPNYFLFNLTRAALASGCRTMGAQSWFRQVPAMLLNRQKEDGSWPAGAISLEGEDTVATCFAMLCLGQCRPAVMINKLSLCDNDSLDAQNLCRYLSRAMRRQVVWQSLTVQTLASALDEAPLLYISGRGEAKFDPALEGPLRRFTDSGGIVLVQAVAGDAKFHDAAKAYFERLLPDLHARPLDKDHPLVRSGRKVSSVPEGMCIGDGSRTSVFIVKGDLSGPWHFNRTEDAAWAFGFGENLVQYATAGRPWPSRLEPKPKPVPTGGGVAIANIRVARIRHAGDWNVSPRAMKRVGETLAAALNIGVDERPAVDLAKPVPADIHVLWMTGAAAPKLDHAHMENLKSFLDAGGTVFIDPAKGDAAFAQAAMDMLEHTFGKSGVTRLPAAHSLLTGEFSDGIGCNVTTAQFTPELAKDRGDDRLPVVWGVHRKDRLAVIFCEMGVTCPAEGVSLYGCRGLTTLDARRLACNVLLYAMRPR